MSFTLIFCIVMTLTALLYPLVEYAKDPSITTLVCSCFVCWGFLGLAALIAFSI